MRIIKTTAIILALFSTTAAHAQMSEDEFREESLYEQRAMRNAVEGIPGQQAMWGAYFRQMDSMSRGYDPQITGGGYRPNMIGIE